MLKEQQQQQQQKNTLYPQTIAGKTTLAPPAKITTFATFKTQPSSSVNANALLINNNSSNINISGLQRYIKPMQSSVSLKRPFIMLAVFFVFGLNIFQFMYETIELNYIS